MVKKKTNFCWAFEKLQAGKTVRRTYWEKGNFDSVSMNKDEKGFLLKMLGGGLLSWSPSIEDIFSEDWELV